MLLLRGTTPGGDIIEFYFDDIIEVYDEQAIVSWGDGTERIVNESVEAVANDTDPMLQ